MSIRQEGDMLSWFCIPSPGTIIRGDAQGKDKIKSSQVLKVHSAATTSPVADAPVMLETEVATLGPADSGPAVLIHRRDSPRRNAGCMARLRVVLWRWKASAGAGGADPLISPATAATVAATRFPPLTNTTAAIGVPTATLVTRSPAAQQPSGERVLHVEPPPIAAPIRDPALRESSPDPSALLQLQIEAATTDTALGSDRIVGGSSTRRSSRHSSVRSSTHTHGCNSNCSASTAFLNNVSQQSAAEKRVASDSGRDVRPAAESTDLSGTQRHGADSNDQAEQRDIGVGDGRNAGSGASDGAAADGFNTVDIKMRVARTEYTPPPPGPTLDLFRTSVSTLDLPSSGPTCAGPAIPIIHSRRGTLLQAVRALQQQTSGRRMHTARYCNYTSAGVEISVAESGGEEWRQIKAPMAARSGGSLRIFHMAQCDSVTGSREGGGAGGARSAGVGMTWKNTPLVLRRLRVTSTSGTSFEQLDILGTGNGAVLAAAASVAGRVPASPETNNRSVQLSPSPIITAAQSTSGACDPPLHFVSNMATFETSQGFLKTHMALDRFTGEAQKTAVAAGGGGSSGSVQRRGRHARFAGADSGSVLSPRTTAPALLARQQTPCPPRWSSALAWCEDSGDLLNEAAGSCWGMTMGTVSEAVDEGAFMKDFRHTAVRLVSSKEQEQEGQTEEEENLVAMGDPQQSATSRGCSYSRLSQIQIHVSGPGQQGQPGHGRLGSPAAALQRRALRVQVSLTKLRRLSVSSLVSLVGLDGERSPATATTATGTPGASLTMALRTSNGGAHAFGGGAMTPTRRGRRRNLAGNENMSWDLRSPRFQIPGSPMLAATAGMATTMESGSSSGLPFLFAIRPGLNDHAAMLDCPDEALRLTEHLAMSVAGAGPLQQAPLAAEAVSEPAAARALQRSAAPQVPVRPDDLSGRCVLQEQRHQQSFQASEEVPMVYQPKTSAAPSPAMELDPICCTICSRASSTCSARVFRPDPRPPSLGRLRMRRSARLVSEGPADDSDNEYGSPSGSNLVSPVARLGSGISRLAHASHFLVAAANGRPVQSNSGGVEDPLPLPLPSPRSTRASHLAPGAVQHSAAARPGSRLGIPRPASVSDVTALAPGCCVLQNSRRVLYHTGSVRSHAPTEDDSAESLAKLGSDLGCGWEKGLDIGASTGELAWGPRGVDPWIGFQALRGDVRKGEALPLEIEVADKMLDGDLSPGRLAGVRPVLAPGRGFDTGVLSPPVRANPTAALVSPGMGTLVAVSTAAGSSVQGHVASSDYLKLMASTSAGVSSRLSRCS